MINYIWFFLIIIGIIVAIFNGKIELINNVVIEDTEEAVKLAIELTGVMAFWLGIMNIAKKSGLINSFSKLVRPITKMLFPEIPEDHPAISSIIMNMVTNMFGAGNSATALGLKAMQDLNSLNKNKTRASNAMVMFLVINMSSIQLVPITVLKLRQSAGSLNPTEIIATSLIATTVSTLVGVVSVKLLERSF